MRRAFPDLRIVSADNDRRFRLELEHDARACDYIAHAGDIQNVEGQYAVINLDTCNGIGVASGLAADMVPKLAPDGLMLVTVMGTDRHNKYAHRAAGFAAELSVATGLRVVCVFRYRMLTRIPAFVIGLTNQRRSGVNGRLPLETLHRQMEADGFYTQPPWAWLQPRHGDRDWERLVGRRWAGIVAVDRPCARAGCPNDILAADRSNKLYCTDRCKDIVGIEAQLTARLRAKPKPRCRQCSGAITGKYRRVFCTTEHERDWWRVETLAKWRASHKPREGVGSAA